MKRWWARSQKINIQSMYFLEESKNIWSKLCKMRKQNGNHSTEVAHIIRHPTEQSVVQESTQYSTAACCDSTRASVNVLYQQ